MTFHVWVKVLAAFTLAFGFFIEVSFSECDDVIVAESSLLGISEEEFAVCGEGEFECRNRECIHGDLVCDGKADCSDQSDETQAECRKPGLTCPNRAFRCDYGACVHEKATCNGVKDCLDNSDELLPQCSKPRDQSSPSSPCRICSIQIFRPRTKLRRPPGQRRRPRPLPSSPPLMVPSFESRFGSSEVSTPSSSSCVVPPQPSNGRWKLHRTFCMRNEDCDVPQGVALPIGSQLVYSCAADFAIRGNSDVYCGAGKSWSSIPTCVAITCSPLNTDSRAAACSRFGDRVSCRSSVLPYTKAKITCNRNYGLEGTFSTGTVQEVECLPNGRWEPEPVTCSPVCGAVNSPGKINDISTEEGGFPWHANLWKEIRTPQGPGLEIQCSATIIDTKFVVTAAHCVMNRRTGKWENPKWLRVTVGRTTDAENSPLDVHKVKSVYRYCEYFGLVHGYASDIALIELIDPFKFTQILQPACLDISSLSEETFEPGTSGKTDGFGRGSARTHSPILQSVEVTYVPNTECRIPQNSSRSHATMNNDEFCGVYSNQTSVCHWDNGGGFVVKRSGLWHLMGIFIMDLGLGEDGSLRTCGESPYALYTKLPPYVAWIEDVMFHLELYKSYPSCRLDLIPPPPPPLMTTATTIWTSTSQLPRSQSPTSHSPTWQSTTPQFPRSQSPTSHLPTWQSTTPQIPTSQNTTSAETSPATSMLTTTPIPEVTGTTSSPGAVDCLVPPQPTNGQWQLHHRGLCDGTNCTIPQGTRVGLGSYLVYTCAPGFRIKGNLNVFCTTWGNWSDIPECIEISCSSLESKSRTVSCLEGDRWGKCNSSSLPNTRAQIYCRVGYHEDTSNTENINKDVKCNQDGEWEPKPITCHPVCGIPNAHVTPAVINGTAANITEFPWHATLYRKMNVSQPGPGEFICGATIIQNNLLLTAAHCIDNDQGNMTDIPGKFSVVTGNKFRDYDSPLHDARIVQKSTVKNLYIPCTYTGTQGNYAWDIALIELETPFQLSSTLIPACLDIMRDYEEIYQPGLVGKIAGFGVTETGKISAALLTTKIKVAGLLECKMSESNDNQASIGKDKFCGKGIMSTGVCNGDSGGGLTFETGGRWYLMGILSSILGMRKSMDGVSCDADSYSLYTKVEEFKEWIRAVMNAVGKGETYSSCP